MNGGHLTVETRSLLQKVLYFINHQLPLASNLIKDIFRIEIAVKNLINYEPTKGVLSSFNSACRVIFITV